MWIRPFVALSVLLMSSAAIADYPYSQVCPSGGKISSKDFFKIEGNYWVDQWKFAQCNCTSYVAYRLNLSGIKFDNLSFGQHWSDGANWDNAAQSAEIIVSALPKRGSVAQWNEKEIAGGYGHVAYVDGVFLNQDGSVKSIVISQYNVVPGLYSVQTLKPGDSGYPPRFIQFNSIKASNSIGWFPPVANCRQATQWFILKDSNEGKIPVGSSNSSVCDQVPLVCFQ
jgi:surface antigen